MRYITTVALIVLFTVSIGFGSLREKGSGSTQDAPKISTEYDPSKDTTTVGFQQLQIADLPSEKLLLSVEGSYPGRTAKKHPDDMVVIFSSVMTKGYKYPQAMALTITADGKRLPQVLMVNFDRRRADSDYLETLGTRMKYDTFLKITQAKKVECMLHETMFTLDESTIKKLVELEKAMHS